MKVIRFILTLALIIAICCGVGALVVRAKNLTFSDVVTTVKDGATDLGETIIDWVNGDSSDNSNSSDISTDTKDIEYSDDAFEFYDSMLAAVDADISPSRSDADKYLTAAKNDYDKLSATEKAYQDINYIYQAYEVLYNADYSTWSDAQTSAKTYLDKVSDTFINAWKVY